MITIFNQKISNINSKGIIFTFDTIFSIMVILLAVLFFVIIINNNISQAISFEKEKYLEEKIVFIADSFVKNFDEKNSLLGACKTDFDKKRVLSNELNETLFSNIKEIDLENFFVKQIFLEKFFAHEIEKTIYSNKKNSDYCLAVKRFVLINQSKKIIVFVGCLNE